MSPRRKPAPPDVGIRIVKASERAPAPHAEPPVAPPSEEPADKQAPAPLAGLRKAVPGRGRFTTAGRVEGDSPQRPGWTPPPEKKWLPRAPRPGPGARKPRKPRRP